MPSGRSIITPKKVLQCGSRSRERVLVVAVTNWSDSCCGSKVGGQALQTFWKGHVFQVPVKRSTKRQALQTGWKGHALQGLVKRSTNRQALQIVWKGMSSRFWL